MLAIRRLSFLGRGFAPASACVPNITPTGFQSPSGYSRGILLIGCGFRRSFVHWRSPLTAAHQPLEDDSQQDDEHREERENFTSFSADSLPEAARLDGNLPENPKGLPYLYSSGYWFMDMTEDPVDIRNRVLEACRRHSLHEAVRGNVMISPEGINVGVCGLPMGVRAVEEIVRAQPGFNGWVTQTCADVVRVVCVLRIFGVFCGGCL